MMKPIAIYKCRLCLDTFEIRTSYPNLAERVEKGRVFWVHICQKWPVMRKGVADLIGYMEEEVE